MGSSESRKAKCARHGQYTSVRFLLRRPEVPASPLRGWTGCPVCAAEAAEQTSANEHARLAKERSQQALKALERKLAGALIPSRFQAKSFDDYVVTSDEQRAALSYLRAYADGFDSVMATGRCLTLVGNTGTGKTHLACAVANSVVKQGYSALFRTVQEVIRHVRSSWRQSGRSEDDAIAELVMPDLLILDEVGVQYGKESELVTLFDVMNARYSARKPCIVISNLPVDELHQFLGDRVMDRLREGNGSAIAFDWESARKQRGDTHEA